ncbi:MAG TPA: ABC transporter permease [Vicinamibacterales bacterium]|nr:ABC transporter permease [Vicinamibacterales bacterium]
MEHLIQDVRYGFRTFIRQPGFALTAILALALGIGANTAVFSVVYAVLLKPLPFASPEQLIYVHDTFPAVPSASVSWPKFLALRDGNRTLSALAAMSTLGNITLTGRGEPQQVQAYRVSGDFFTVLGVGPLFGRALNRDDDVPNGGKVIALGYGLWQRRFGADPRIIGQAVMVDGEAFTVASIMPASFNYPAGTEAWIPLALPAKFQGNNFLRLIGRMKPGSTLQQATDDLRALTRGYNEANKLKRDVQVVSLSEYLTRARRQMLLVLQGAVGFVLLIACANVANLLLARSVSRTRELAVRSALGAGRFRLVQQMLTESLVLSVAGSIVGILVASWLLRLFAALAPDNFSGVNQIELDLQVLTATLAIAMVTGILFGLAPARQGFRVDPNEGLRDTSTRGATGPGAKRAGRTLVVAEISLAVVLVIGAGLMLKSLLRLESQNAGFRSDGVMTLQISLPQAKYGVAERVSGTHERILEQIRALPGVKAAGAINFLPLVNFGLNGGFGIVGRPPFPQQDRAPVLEYRCVTPGYFAAMGIPVLRGRDYNELDTAKSTPVVMINATMAKQFWPNANPIGEHLNLGQGPQNQPEIVGVVGDVRSASLAAAPVIESYFPLSQTPINTMGIVVRAETADPATLLPAIRQRIAEVDPDLPVVKPQTLRRIVEASAGGTRLSSVLTAVFALLAALLAAMGIYSLIAYSVAERTRELGIRVALGAERRTIVRLIVGEGLGLASIGMAIGLLGSWLLTGTLQTMLYEVSPIDPAVLAATCLSVLAVTALASYVPARRALRVDPMIALRSQG